MFKTTLKFWFLIIGLFFISSCGKKSPPLSIEESIPSDFEFEVEATQAGFNLWITLPTKTQGNHTLVSIKKLLIEKGEKSLDLPQAKERREIIKLSPKLHSAGNLFLYSDYRLKHRHQYSYRIKIVKDFLVETDWSPWIKVFWHNPPGLPKNFDLKILGKRKVFLTWERPPTDIFGLYLEGEVFYELFKRIENQEKVWQLRKTEFLDEPSENQRTCYSVRTVLNFRDTLIPGPKTPEKCVTF
ncbi:MAG: hypothetical protein NZ530_03120 [Thermodesulfobacteriaceae bacterium]|nr:hypothetical protein [Thermodesulfobacteriaceae bacterium]